jgi:hypothetical protein
MRQDNAVIRIRYRDFSAGTHTFTAFHGVARWGARGVTVYLVPGLTVRERKAVLRRLRQEASRGFGPPLPLLALVFALCADRVRTTAGTGAALVRLHPAVTLLPGALVAAVMTLFVFACAGRSVDFPAGTGAVPQLGGLALLPVGSAGQDGRAQASPVWDSRSLIVEVNSGSAQGNEGGQSLGLGDPAPGKCAHDGCAKGKATGHSATKSGDVSSGSGNGDGTGNGKGGSGSGNAGPAGGARLMALPPVTCTAVSRAGCSASVRPAIVPRPGDRPAAGPAGLGTVKRGVGIG